MRGFVSLFLLFFFSLNVFAQDDQVLVTIGGHKFTKGEFERIYKKNNSNLLEDKDKKNPEQYLDLFIDFELKVIEAENLKMDTVQSFINELASYRKDLTAPYLTDVSYTDKMVRDTYQRMLTEVKASHILIGIKGDKTPADTLKAYNKAMDIRNKIMNGLDFNEAAYEYSDDPSAKSNRGNLGYFSAFQTVYPFEVAAYQTPVGQVSMPVRSSFGYHLIKVTDKRPARGEVKVAQIMKSFPPDATQTTQEKLKSQIDSIYDQLKKGADFAKMAEKYSDDRRSAVNGGELAWFSSGMMDSVFANAAFALKKNGDISKPIKTKYGYHIIKRLDSRPVKSFEEAKPDIIQHIKNDPERSRSSKDEFIKKLKKEYGFGVNAKVEEDIKNNRYSLLSNGGEGTDLTNPLFGLNGKKFTVGMFFSFMKNNHPEVKEFDSNSFDKYFNEWVGKELTDYEDSRLEEKYPEFRDLMQEYHDGILLFDISDKKIWSYAAKDSAGLQKYYEKNKGKYMWGERFKGAIIRCNDSDTRDEVDKYFAADMNDQDVLDLVNKDQNKVTIEEGAWEKNVNPIVDYYVWNGDKPANFDEELTFVRGNKIGPEPKLLNEARGLYLSDYQDYLEKEWVKELRAKYPVKVNKKLLKTISNASE